MSNTTINSSAESQPSKTGFSFGTGLLVTLALISLILAVYSLISPHDLTGLNNKTPWGFLISAYAFFVSSIGACFVGSLGSVFGVKKYVAIEKRAIFLAIIFVVVGMSIIFVELGQPFRMFIGYAKNPNPASPIWWMGVNYTLYLTFIIAEFIFLVKNNFKSAKILGIFAFIAAVAAHSTVGSVFGLNHARPFWYGPYMPIDFILCAWILGFALMIVILHDKVKSDIHNTELVSLIQDMGKWLAVFLAVNMFFIFWKITTGLYGAEGVKYLATAALVKGPLSMRFWAFEIILGLILPFLMLISSSKTTGSIFTAAWLSMIGMFVNKMNMVQAGQMLPNQIFNYDNYLKYSPSIVEIGIIAGAIALVILIYGAAEKYYFVKIKEG